MEQDVWLMSSVPHETRKDRGQWESNWTDLDMINFICRSDEQVVIWERLIAR